MRKSWHIALTVSVCVLAASSANAQRTPTVAPGSPYDYGGAIWMELWPGFVTSRTFFGEFGGGTLALNLKNLYTDGAILRVEAINGKYDTNRNTSVPFGCEAISATCTSVNTRQASILLGYRKDVGPGWVTAYIGPAYEEHLNAPVGARLRGSETGVRGALEFIGRRFENFDFYGFASYSGNFDTYFVFARPGLWVADHVRIGPEGQLYGNVAYSDYKVGAYAQVITPDGLGLTFAGGYLRPQTAGVQDGYYALVHLTFQLKSR